MPEPPWLQKRYPGKTHLLRDAAAQNQLVSVKCNLCRRAVTFLATDLIAFCDPAQPALTVPFPCSRCQTTEFMRVTLGSAVDGDWGNLTIRRPGPVRVIQTWRSVKLGDP